MGCVRNVHWTYGLAEAETRLMNKTTHHKTDDPRFRVPHVLPSGLDEARQRGNGESKSQTLECTVASCSYDAQVDRLLKRIRKEKSFEAQMIRSILGHSLLRR